MPRRRSEHPLVQTGIDEIVDYIAFHGPSPNPGLAERVAVAIQNAIDRAGEAPEQYPVYTELENEFPNLRRCIALPYRNYLVFYDLTEDEVRILYAFEASRDISERIGEQPRL
jgi:plasmid stabilization system protein ParE